MINDLYQTSLETLWDHLSRPEEPVLPIAPHGIRLNQEYYQQLTEKQKMLLRWGLHIAKLAASFEPTKQHINREKDILRGIAAILGRTLNSADFEAETFEQEKVACSVIRELDVSSEQKKAAWSTLENTCKNNDVFSRHITFDYALEALCNNLTDHSDIWQQLPELFAKLGRAEETIDSGNWCQYARFFYKHNTTHNLAWFSLLSVMSCLKLGYLHIANQQSISLYCKLFKGDHSTFNPDETESYQDIIISGKLKCTIEGLASYLQKVTDLIKPNQNFHAAFAEGIMATIPRKRIEQLAQTIRSFTKKSILCARLSSSCPGQIAVTALLKDQKPYHMLYSVEQYYQGIKAGVLGGIQLHGTHRIMPGGNFDHEALLKQQKIKYVNTLNRYVEACNSPGLGSALQRLDRYTLPIVIYRKVLCLQRVQTKR